MADAPTHVTDLATACVHSVKQTLDIALDLQPDTLPILDHYVREILERDAEGLALGVSICGAYFGEVVRRRFESVRWFAPQAISDVLRTEELAHGEMAGDPYPEWRLEFEQVFLHFNPLGVALEVAETADAAGWKAHLGVQKRDREAVDASVALFGVARERDYYSFTVRFEVLEQVVEALVRERQHRKESPGSYGPVDYASAPSILS